MAGNLFIQIQKRPLQNSENKGRKELGNCFKSSFSKWEISRKDIILAGDFNINLIDFDGNKKLQIFVNLVFCFGMVLVNKPMRVTEQTGSAIGHFIANSITQTGFKSGIIKTGISDHFLFFFCCCKYIAEKSNAKMEFIYKLKFSDQSIDCMI